MQIYLVIWEMKGFEVRMFQSFFDGDSLCRVENQEFLQEVKSLRIGIREESLQWLWLLLWERFKQFPAFLPRNSV